MTVIAFSIRGHMILRFPNGQHTVMTTAALAKHFLMIHITNDLESKRGMTRFTYITGRHVIAGLAHYRINRALTLGKVSIMTIITGCGITGVYTLVTRVITGC